MIKVDLNSEYLLRLPLGVEHEILFHNAGNVIPMKYFPLADSETLLVLFHGAIDREKRALPVYFPFIPNLPEKVTQLSISDPSIFNGRFVGLSWYAGHEGFETQSMFVDFFKSLKKAGKFKKIIFFGGSGGGFSALYYSSFLEKSVAIAGAPQTNLLTYSKGHLKRYMEDCWPTLKSEKELASKICVDLAERYKVNRHNLIVYIQSLADYHHVRTQVSPFLSTISKIDGSRYVVNSDYWGRLGHSGSVTPEAYIPWLRAVVSSPSIEIEDLLRVYYDFKTQKMNASKIARVNRNNQEINLARLSEIETRNLLLSHQMLRRNLNDD